MSEAINKAMAAQAEAADPRSSAFVSANAGSGKTHVLINRVTRLLMDGVNPENILCVTYTKAAATEMLNRLFERLGGYSIMDNTALREELRKLDPDIPVGTDDLRRARALFALALETPGGLKIRTIHSFCESLLRRFPAEAGINPGFAVLDDRMGAQIRAEAIADIGYQALNHPQGQLAKAIDHVAALGADKLETLYAFAAKEGRRLAALIEREGDMQSALALSAGHLGLPVEANRQSEAEAAWQNLDHLQLKRLAETMAGGGKTDKKCAKAITEALGSVDKCLAFEIICTGFFTQAGTPPKSLPTKAVQKAQPWVIDAVPDIQDVLDQARGRIRAAAVLDNSRAALVLSDAFYRRYSQAKTALGALDFDDLIAKSVELLSHADAAAWVLYKLDYNLSHILVDEAQDNSDGQWSLIRSLSMEFFAGKGAQDNKARTLFAVGDPKQSIYSFQGANPALFLSEAQHLLTLTSQRENRFVMPELALSWRSCPQVLAMVDETFAPFTGETQTPPELETKFAGDVAHYEDVAPGSPGFADYVPHQAQRADAAGCVELWDSIPRPIEVPEEDPGAPVDAPSPQSARNVLAARIATTIAQWLNRREIVSEKKGQTWHQRPMRPGDIMILLRNRTGGLFEEIIRQLKLRHVPVAGADRMVLAAQTAVRDMMSAARAALQVHDDLAVAEFLRSPFLQPAANSVSTIDEDALYDLAAERPQGQSLSAALHTSDDPRFAEAKKLMSALRELAGSATPFAFFAGLLYRPSASGESYARRLYARLGAEAEDPVREFLSRALAHEAEQAPVLARFVAQNLNDEAQIKREMESAGNAVRVMTVHAAKGLEAPLVILPDTAKGSGRPRGSGLMFATKDNAFFWSPLAREDPPVCASIRDAAAEREAEEHKRLLYVAMTRAQDRLVVCGAQMGKGEGIMAEDSWYAYCRAAFERRDEQGEVETYQTSAGVEAMRFGPPPQTRAESQITKSDELVFIPDWAKQPQPPEAPALRRAAPSRWLDAEDDAGPVLSPLADGGAQRYQRGLLIHTLLQSLPEIDGAARLGAARNFLEAQIDLDKTQCQEIIDAVFGVLNEPAFAALFGPDSRAELPISGRVSVLAENVILAGQIDRLVVTEDEVLVVDYKTNRPAPKEAKAVSLSYLQQMAAYRTLLKDVWPGHKIRCALLWTDGPGLMPLADSLLDEALQNGHTP